MEQWEYFTTVIEANTDVVPVPVMDEIPFADHPVHSSYTLIPQLNKYGEKGWELVAIQAVIQGKKHDVVIPSAGYWGEHYFCTFKRRLADTP